MSTAKPHGEMVRLRVGMIPSVSHIKAHPPAEASVQEGRCLTLPSILPQPEECPASSAIASTDTITHRRKALERLSSRSPHVNAHLTTKRQTSLQCLHCCPASVQATRTPPKFNVPDIEAVLADCSPLANATDCRLTYHFLREWSVVRPQIWYGIQGNLHILGVLTMPREPGFVYSVLTQPPS